MSTVKIALVGAAGRMGREITMAASQNPNAEMGAAVEYEGSPMLGKDLGDLAGLDPNGVSLSSDLEGAAAGCDVILDVSLPSATIGVVEVAKKIGKPLVCGITGLGEEFIPVFEEAGKTIPVIHTKNFSVGIAVLADLCARASKILGPDYDVEIIEKHHKRKQDAPSGTAEILRDSIIDAAPALNRATVYGRRGAVGARPDGEIGVHAVRGGGIFGEHTVMFASENERVEITHKAETRALFAQGAVRTAVFLAGMKPGNYTMKDVLGL